MVQKKKEENNGVVCGCMLTEKHAISHATLKDFLSKATVCIIPLVLGVN